MTLPRNGSRKTDYNESNSSLENLPLTFFYGSEPFLKQHIHTAPITHRDPEITKIIKKPNRHFRLYVVSDFSLSMSISPTVLFKVPD